MNRNIKRPTKFYLNQYGGIRNNQRIIAKPKMKRTQKREIQISIGCYLPARCIHAQQIYGECKRKKSKTFVTFNWGDLSWPTNNMFFSHKSIVSSSSFFYYQISNMDYWTKYEISIWKFSLRRKKGNDNHNNKHPTWSNIQDCSTMDTWLKSFVLQSTDRYNRLLSIDHQNSSNPNCL